jgi:glycosyltransferase involved in cell wall biosynthesis
MKVLYSCLSRSWGGLEMRTIQGAQQLLKRNIPTEILCYPQSKIHIEAKALGLITRTLRASGYVHPIQIIKLINLLNFKNYDIIHTQASKDLWTLVPALKLLRSKIPLILTKRVGSFIIKKDFLHRWLYERLTCIIAISREIKQNVIETCPIPEEKVMLIYNGVDLEKFNPDKTDYKKIRNEFNIKEDEIVIGMLARFSQGKGHEEFLSAAKELIKRHNDLRFIIVGEPSAGEDGYAGKIKDLTLEYNIADKVIFTGFRSDIPDLLFAMDIFTFPSHSEAFGNALIEAMAMGKPSVCSNSAGVPEIAVEGKTGYFFKKQDADDLTRNLELLIDSPVNRKAFGEAARYHVKQNFDLNRVTDKILAIYHDALTNADTTF